MVLIVVEKITRFSRRRLGTGDGSEVGYDNLSVFCGMLQNRERVQKRVVSEMVEFRTAYRGKRGGTK